MGSPGPPQFSSIFIGFPPGLPGRVGREGAPNLSGLNLPTFVVFLIRATLWLFNIAMGNGTFVDCLPIKIGDFP